MSDVLIFHVPTVQLQTAAGYVAHAASKDRQGAPMLCGIELSWGTAVHGRSEGTTVDVAGLTFAATDRYRLAVATVPSLPGPLDEPWPTTAKGSIVVDAAELAAAMKRFTKPPRGVYGTQWATVEIDFDGDDATAVTFRDGSGTTLLVGMVGTFPAWQKLIPGKVTDSSLVALNPKYLAEAAKASQLVASRSGACRMVQHGPKVLFVHDASDGQPVMATELIMQVRLPEHIQQTKSA